MPSVMSSSAKNKKPKPSKSSGKSKSAQNVIPTDGAYTNPRLIHTVLTLMGSKCNAQVKNGGIYQGIFHTVNSDMDFMLGAAHLQQAADENSVPSINSVASNNLVTMDKLFQELIFSSKGVVCAVFQDVDLSFANVSVKSNGDASIDANSLTSNGENLRTLEKWVGSGDDLADVGGLEDDSNQNGWCPEDMFRTNTNQYGVQSSYNPDLPEYTTKLNEDDSEEFKKRRARAQQLANQIEKSPSYNKHINLELDENTTEEEKFSSVVRNQIPSQSAPMRDRRGSDRGSSDRLRRGSRNKDQGRNTYGGNNYPMGMNRGPQPYGQSGGRSTPTGESPTSPGSNKSFNKPPSNQTLPPRFAKNSGGVPMHNREDDRMRPYDQVYHGQHNPKPQRQNSGSKVGYQRNHQSPTSEFSTQQSPSEPTSGQVTPQQSLSRNSSTSSVTQQQVTSPQWGKPPSMQEERPHMPPSGQMHPSAPIPGSQIRQQFPNTGGKDSSSYSSVLRNNPQASKMGPPMQKPGYSDARGMQQDYPNQTPPGVPRKGPTLIYYPKGHTPPIPPTQPDQPGLMIHPNQMAPSSSGRPLALSQYSAPSPSKPSDTKTGAKVISKKSTEGPSIHQRETDPHIKKLKEFKENFRLSETVDTSKSSSGPKPTLGGSSKHQMTKQRSSMPSSRPPPSVVQESSPIPSVTSQPLPPQNQMPPHPIPQQTLVTHPHPPAVNITQAQGIPQPHPVDTMGQDMLSPVIPVLLPGGSPQQIMFPIPAPVQPLQIIQASEQPQPSINIHSPRSTSSTSIPSAVNTVSAATGFVSPQHPTVPPSVSIESSNIQSPAQPLPPAPTNEIQPDPTASITTGEQPHAGGDPQSANTPPEHQLNPDAKEFTPRALTKPSGLSTPTSPTQIPQQQQQQLPFNYYPQANYNNYKIMKRGAPAVISPTGNEMVAPHVVHQTSTGQSTFMSQYPTHFVLTHGAPQPMTPTNVMTTPQYQGVDMVYQPVVHPSPRPVQAASYPPNEQQVYGYPQTQPIHLAQQPQQVAVASQQPPQQPTPVPPPQTQPHNLPQPGYIPQQGRPHSAHTPNQALPPTSPATNIQQPPQQTGSTMVVNAPPPNQMHPSVVPNTPQNFYSLHQPHVQPPTAAAAMVPHSPHGATASYQGFPQRFVMYQGAPQITHSPNPSNTQPGYMQQAVPSSQPHVQTQYTPRPAYHQMIPNFSQQQPPN